MAKKYAFTGETKQVAGHTLHRIRAVRDVGTHVKKGDLGGWIESEKNLSQGGDCWVGDEACVYGRAEVYGHAEVLDNARVYGDAWVYGRANVLDHAQVYGIARVYDDAYVLEGAKVGDAWVHDNACVRGDAVVLGGAACGHAHIRGDARIGSDADYTVLRNSWSSGRWITYTRSNRMWSAGCFYGTGDQLIKKAYMDADSGLKGKCYETIVGAVEQIGDMVLDKAAFE